MYRILFCAGVFFLCISALLPINLTNHYEIDVELREADYLRYGTRIKREHPTSPVSDEHVLLTFQSRYYLKSIEGKMNPKSAKSFKDHFSDGRIILKVRGKTYGSVYTPPKVVICNLGGDRNDIFSKDILNGAVDNSKYYHLPDEEKELETVDNGFERYYIYHLHNATSDLPKKFVIKIEDALGQANPVYSYDVTL